MMASFLHLRTAHLIWIKISLYNWKRCLIFISSSRFLLELNQIWICFFLELNLIDFNDPIRFGIWLRFVLDKSYSNSLEQGLLYI
jgi:hypothetical protein